MLQVTYLPLQKLRESVTEVAGDYDIPAKRHDVGGLSEIFYRYGFKVPVLINSNFGIAAGRGRVKTLASLKDSGREAPTDIDDRGDDWYVPCIPDDGEDAKLFLGFLIDENNSGLMGGPIAPETKAAIWEDGYLDALEALARDCGDGEEPSVSVDADDLDAMLEGLRAIAEEPIEVKAERSGKLQEIQCPHCGKLFEKRR